MSEWGVCMCVHVCDNAYTPSIDTGGRERGYSDTASSHHRILYLKVPRMDRTDCL